MHVHLAETFIKTSLNLTTQIITQNFNQIQSLDNFEFKRTNTTKNFLYYIFLAVSILRILYRVLLQLILRVAQNGM